MAAARLCSPLERIVSDHRKSLDAHDTRWGLQSYMSVAVVGNPIAKNGLVEVPLNKCAKNGR